MSCPECGRNRCKVLETRDAKDDTKLFRRRQCRDCFWEFVTVEEVRRRVAAEPLVI